MKPMTLMMISILPWIFILPVIFISCNKDDDELISNNQQVYFQFEFVNYAWGFQHYGFIIDPQGNIYDYELPAEWNFATNNQISIIDFQANLDKSEIRSTRLTDDKLQQMKNIAQDVLNGNLSDPNYVMADAGNETYSVYTAEEGSESFTYHLLQSRGDVYQKNTSYAATEIANWLININDGGLFQEDHFLKETTTQFQE